MKVEIKKEGKQEVLSIEIPIEKRPSKSGKSTLLASSNGNFQTDIVYDGKPIIIGLNAYIK